MKKKLMRISLITALLAVLVSLAGAAENGLFDTKTAASHTEKGIASLKDKKYDAAIKELEESASIYPDAEAFYYLGYAYYMKGKTGDGESRKKSRENFEKAYELNPNFTPSRLKPSEPVPGTAGPKQEKAEEPQPRETEPGVNIFQAQPTEQQPPSQPQPTQQPEQPKEQPPQPTEPGTQQPPQQTEPWKRY